MERDILPHYLGKKELTRIIDRLQHVRRVSTLETSSFRNICAFKESPAKFEDGRAVTEGNVDEFIRERVRLHHSSWITQPLEEIIEQMVNSIYGSGKWRK
jgi:hypothetical protein